MSIDLIGKEVLVVGSGISGIAAVRLLERIGALPVLYDANDNLSEQKIRERLSDEVKCRIILGELPNDILNTAALAVVSPGVPQEASAVLRIREQLIPVWGEIELGYRLGRGRIAAITGTNGKTTTTALVGEIMKSYFASVYVVGNIGKPYTDIVSETLDDSVIVAEVSSFQLETVIEFTPEVSAVLNITPDHLDRHGTMESYVKLKEKIAANQSRDSVCVLNYENEYTRDFGARCPAGTVYFSTERELEKGYFLSGEDICCSSDGKVEKLMNIHEMKLKGLCNVENVMAAIAISSFMGVPMEHILAAVRSFKAVEHRIEYVAEKNGVEYYNDSKGTNPDAAVQGIKAMTRPTVLLAGGYDKGSDYNEWMEACTGKVKALILIGATREKIAACAFAHGIENILLAETFPEALEKCREQAESGDAVLLSPACASWGMFPDYEVRGNRFKEYVLSLADRLPTA